MMKPKPQGYYTDKVFTPADMDAAIAKERERVVARFTAYESQLVAQAMALQSEGLASPAQDHQLDALRLLREAVLRG